MRISDWSSDVCSSDLQPVTLALGGLDAKGHALADQVPGRDRVVLRKHQQHDLEQPRDSLAAFELLDQQCILAQWRAQQEHAAAGGVEHGRSVTRGARAVCPLSSPPAPGATPRTTV